MFSCLNDIKEGLKYELVFLGNTLICHYSSISIVLIAKIKCSLFFFFYFRKITFVSFLSWGMAPDLAGAERAVLL